MEMRIEHSLGDAIRALEELEMQNKRYVLEKIYNTITTINEYPVAWVIVYEEGEEVSDIPERWFED